MTGIWLTIAQCGLIGIGHAVIWTYLLNVLYGCRIPKRLLKPWRLLTFVVIVFGWPIFLVATLGIPDSLASVSAAIMEGPIRWYAWGCLALGAGFIGWTIVRWFRSKPPALLQETTSTIDYHKTHGPGVYGRGQWWWLARLPLTDAFRVEFVERTIAVRGCPAAWDGLAILHLSDFHFHGTPSRFFFETLMADIRSKWPAPDLVCLTGDYVDTDDHHRWIGPVLSPLIAEEAKLAILGNHDEHHQPETIRTHLAGAGYRVVGNRRERITVRGEPMDVVGHEGPWFRPPPEQKPSDVPLLGLSHSPDNASWAAEIGCFLTLAGHVHGGQIRVPLVGSIFVPSRNSRKYDGGVYDVAGMPMVVSRGLSGKEPIRFRCQPQVILVRLRTIDER